MQMDHMKLAVELGRPKTEMSKRDWQRRLVKLEAYKLAAEKQLKNQEVRREDNRETRLMLQRQLGLLPFESANREPLKVHAKAVLDKLQEALSSVENLQKKVAEMTKDLSQAKQERDACKKLADAYALKQIVLEKEAHPLLKIDDEGRVEQAT